MLLTSCCIPPAAFVQMDKTCRGTRRDSRRTSHSFRLHRWDLRRDNDRDRYRDRQKIISEYHLEDAGSFSRVYSVVNWWYFTESRFRLMHRLQTHRQDSSIHPGRPACCRCTSAPGCRMPGSSWCIPCNADLKDTASLVAKKTKHETDVKKRKTDTKDFPVQQKGVIVWN